MLGGASPASPLVDGPAASAAGGLTAGGVPAAPVVYVVGAWRRTAAGLLDALVLLPVLLLAGSVLSWIVPHATAQPPQQLRAEVLVEMLLRGDPLFVGVLLLLTLLGTLYQVLFLASFGATPGLRLVRATVIDAYGLPPSARRVLLRCVGQALGLLPLGLGLLWTAFDAEKRGLQDWLAGTYVIRRTSASGAPAQRPSRGEPARGA